MPCKKRRKQKEKDVETREEEKRDGCAAQYLSSVRITPAPWYS
jgi:hypothetical protein